jgi:hypothetical protein
MRNATSGIAAKPAHFGGFRLPRGRAPVVVIGLGELLRDTGTRKKDWGGIRYHFIVDRARAATGHNGRQPGIA